MNARRHKAAAVVLYAILVHGAPAHARTEAQAEPAVRADLVRTIRAWLHRVDSLRVTTRSRYEDNGTSRYIHATLRIAAPDSMRLDYGHGTATRSWKHDLLRARTFVSADRSVREWVAERTYESLDARATTPIRLAANPFVLVQGWWPTNGKLAGAVTWACPAPLLECATNPEYTVTRTIASDGRPRVVLMKPDEQRIVIDPERGCLVVRRERLGDGNETLIRFDAERPRRIAPGVWLPMRWLSWAIKPGEAADWTRPTVTIDVLDVDASPADPDAFMFIPPPGSVLMKRDSTDWRQVVPGGLDYLEARGREMRDVYLAGTDAESPNRLWWMLAAGALLLGLAEIHARLRVGRQTPETQEAPHD